MDSATHLHMRGLVQRASAASSFGHHSTYYPNDGSNDPPPSPTAKWKGGVHAHEEPLKDNSRFPYLPHPYPLKRRGRAHSGHPGGFQSLQEPLQPPKFPDDDQIYCTYAEWWQAQRPPTGLPTEKDATFSTSFWPYGRRISCVATNDKEGQFYTLDKRLMKNHTFYKDKREPLSSTAFGRSRSSAELFGSQAEHFGYNRTLGRSMSSHASASFHEQNRMPAGEPFAPNPGKLAGKRNVWDSLKAEASSTLLPTASGLRAGSAPSTSRSLQAQGGSTSRNDPHPKNRQLGLAQRTNTEWCLPQAPVYAHS